MIKPLRDNILVKELPPEDNRAGLTIPWQVRQDPIYELVAKGPDCDKEIQVGDRLVLDQYRLDSKTKVGPELWVVAQKSVAIVIPHASGNQT